jgi:phosphoribosylformylglycinamidine synthase subunit PurS
VKFKAKIFVILRPSVLDPAGTAVKSALDQMPDQMQHGQVESVRIGKFIEMVIDVNDVEMATQQVNIACDRLLANPVIETYTFELSPYNQD